MEKYRLDELVPNIQEILDEAREGIVKEVNIFYNALKPKFVDQEIWDRMSLDKELYKETDDIYSTPAGINSTIYMYIKDRELIGLVKVVRASICIRAFFVPVLILKKNQSYKGVALKILKTISKKYKLDILSDKQHSIDSFNMYTKWFTDPKKYGIKSINILNMSTCKIEYLNQHIKGYSFDELAKEDLYRFIVKFK